MIQRIEQQLFPPLSHPHPQLVAVKSLMLSPPNYFLQCYDMTMGKDGSKKMKAKCIS